MRSFGTRSQQMAQDESQETKQERVNRELIELLNELRVALPGVQVLFAFLLAVPFSQGFTRVNSFQRDLFFGTLVATALSSALLIAPSAYHRIHFRQQNKEELLVTSNKLSMVGLALLALAMVGAVVLISDYLFGPAVTVGFGVAVGAVFGWLWLALPVQRRRAS